MLYKSTGRKAGGMCAAPGETVPYYSLLVLHLYREYEHCRECEYNISQTCVNFNRKM